VFLFVGVGIAMVAQTASTDIGRRASLAGGFGVAGVGIAMVIQTSIDGYQPVGSRCQQREGRRPT